jgi:MFS family permease
VGDDRDGAGAGAGAAVGVLAGGLLVEYASWRWVFYINLPVGILLAATVPALIATVRPAARSSGGLRLYSPADVERVALMQQHLITIYYFCSGLFCVI